MNQFAIYQLKHTKETRFLRFTPMKYLEKEGLAVVKENYNLKNYQLFYNFLF